MRSPRNLPIYLGYLVGCLLAIGYIVSQMGLTPPWSHPYRLTAEFTNASGVLPNNEVLMNGVRIGRVDSVVARGGVADVTMVITDGHGFPVYSDAVAQIRKKNLLGETYIDLHRGGSGKTLPDGGDIPVSQTLPITEIDQVLAIFDPDTRQRLQLLINTLGTGTQSRGGDLNSQGDSANRLTTSLNPPAGELSVRRQQIADIVLELQQLYDMLAKQRAQVRDEFGTWNDVTAQMAAQEQQLGGTLQQADTLLTNVDTLVTGEGANLQAALREAPGALNNTIAFLQQAATAFNGVAPYRAQIHDVFPHLASSFADTDPTTGQHFWSVFSVNCNSGCGNQNASDGISGSSAVAGTASLSWSGLFGGGSQ